MKIDKNNLQSLQLRSRHFKLSDRLNLFNQFMSEQTLTYKRTVLTAADRNVSIRDPFTGIEREMLMFASNNYLGLANHPHVEARIKKAMNDYGSGIGGPPLLNGYIGLIEELEERLAAFKNQEAAIVFSSGFMANLGIVTGLAESNDIIIYDELSHASFYDGIKMSRAKSVPFAHNDTRTLEELLHIHSIGCRGTTFVCTEGVYSMDGDLAPLQKIAALCAAYNALLIVDDAHGTGVLGVNGAGTASHLDCEKSVDISMGTFSKVFATCGGFVTASADLVEYLRYHSRPYIFSASIPPTVAAAVLGGLEVIENEPWLRVQLHENTRYAIEKLRPFGFYANPEAAIITLSVPSNMDIRKAAILYHQKDIFLNPVEYPAVPATKQRFRISIMATHQEKDIDKLARVTEEIWNDPTAYIN